MTEQLPLFTVPSRSLPDLVKDRTTKVLHRESFSYVGVFGHGKLRVLLDPNDTHTRRFISCIEDGWGAGKARRHATLEDAKADLPKLAWEYLGVEL